MNVLIEYLYRDAGNNKLWGDVIFSNKMNVDVARLDADIKKTLIDGEFFVAEEVFLPPLQFEKHDIELDHGWHEYFSVGVTAERPNDHLNRDICEFICMLKSSRVYIEQQRP